MEQQQQQNTNNKSNNKESNKESNKEQPTQVVETKQPVIFSYLQNRKVKVEPIVRKGNPFGSLVVEEIDHEGNYRPKNDVPLLYNNIKKIVTVPISSATGRIKQILNNTTRKQTKEYPYMELTEQEFFEMQLGFSKGDLDIVKTVNDGKGNAFQYSYWYKKVGAVELGSSPITLDLSIPQDMLTYKILMSNTNPINGIIAPDKESALSNKRYLYVLLDIETEMLAETENNKIKEFALQHYFKYVEGNNMDKLNKLFSLIENKWQASDKMDAVRNQVFDYVQKEPKKYLELVEDPSMDERLFLLKAIKHQQFYNRGGVFVTQDGIKTGNFKETLNWIIDPENFSRVERIKNSLEKLK